MIEQTMLLLVVVLAGWTAIHAADAPQMPQFARDEQRTAHASAPAVPGAPTGRAWQATFDPWMDRPPQVQGWTR